MRAFTERPKSMIASTKRAFTSEDVPLKTTSSSVATTSMRRANTNESLVNLELAALGSSPSSTSSSPASSAPVMGSTPPQDHSEWAQKQLMDMVNRSADGQRVTGEDLVENFQTRGSAFSKHGKSRSALAPSPTPLSTSPLGHSQPISNPMDVPKQQQQQRSLISSTSTSALLTAPTIRRAPVSNVLEARMKMKREKDLQMARSIMEEELKKARDREKLREVEHRLKAKAEEQQEEERLRAYYEHEKQHSQPTNTTNDDNFAYFKSMKKKIKDINVKPNLPSIGLDEKLKKFNTRVKGFLSTTNPAAGFSQKFRGEKKRDSKHVDRNLPIKLNIVDDFMKDLEYQKRMANDPSDTRGLSPIIEVRNKPTSGPSELQQKRAARRKRFSQLEFSKSNGELQMLVRSISQGLEANNDAITNANHTCARIRAEMESTKTLLTRDVDSTNSKVSRTSQMGTQFATSVSEIRAQLDATRSATTSCSDQIKHLEVRVHKVQRAKKPADTVMRYLAWGLFGLAIIYLVAKSRTCQVLAVLAFMTLVVRIIKDRRYSSSQALINIAGQGSPFQQHQVRKIEVDAQDDVTSSSESLPVHPSTSSSSSSSSSPKLTIHPAPTTNLGSSFIRRNHSDLVLQSLLSEEEFAEVILNDSPKLKTLKEEDESMGISPSRSRRNDPNTTTTNNNNNNTTNNNTNYTYNNNNSNNEPQQESTGPKLRSSIRSGGPLRTSGGSLRTSTTNKDSVAMNLALHNLNQMSLKIQQMQLGK